MGRKQWDAYLGQISYMFQNNALFDSLSVFENVAMPLRENTRLSQSDMPSPTNIRPSFPAACKSARPWPVLW
jgi:phospholipid/cholesterol/gamma-HCH transport system ATP-binding protein